MNDVFEGLSSMTDLLIGLVFVAMTVGPAVLGWMQWTKYATAKAEALAEDCAMSAIRPDQP